MLGMRFAQHGPEPNKGTITKIVDEYCRIYDAEFSEEERMAILLLLSQRKAVPIY